MNTLLWLWYPHNHEGDFMNRTHLAYLKRATLIEGGAFDGRLALEGTTIEDLLLFLEANGNHHRVVGVSRHKIAGYTVIELESR